MAPALKCRHTEPEDLFEVNKLREKIKSQGGTTGVSSETKLSTIIAFSTLSLTAVNPNTDAVVGVMSLAPCEALNHVLPGKEEDPEIAYTSTREKVCPALTVRPAVVEDTDDLYPIVEGAAARFGSLAKVPCGDGTASAVADFLVAKDANATVLAVEDNTFNIRGLLAVSSAVDAALLLQHFDLSAYDGLLSSQEYAELVAEAEAAIFAQQQAAAEAKAAEIKEETIAKQKEEQEQAEAAKAADALCGFESQASRADEKLGQENSDTSEVDESGLPSLLTSASINVAPAPVEAPVAADESGTAVNAEPPTLQPYTIADIQGRAADAILTAFRNFPICEWLLATLPCDEQPPDCLAHFDCVAPLPWSPFPHKLFLLHRKSLSRVNVSKACASDRAGVQAMFDGMLDADTKMETYDAACSSNLCAVARLAILLHRHAQRTRALKGFVIGTVALTEPQSLASLSSQYTLSAAIDVSKYSASLFASMSLCAINPIFTALSRDIVSAAAAILHRPILLASPAEASAVVSSGASGGMFQHIPPAPGASPPPMLLLAPPLVHRRKLALDIRVVVVGASETALAALRSIAMRRDAALPRVTILAPLGQATAPALLDPHLQAVTHDARVTVLDASMVAINRDSREVELEDGTMIVYDVLVLAPGLHNATLSAVKDGGISSVCSAEELTTHLTAADAAELTGVIVYGDTLQALTAMGTLAAQGVHISETALHVAPEGNRGPGLDVLLEIAEDCGVVVDQPQAATLTRLEAITDQQTFHCFFDSPDHPEGLQVQADLLVAAETPDVSPIVFEALCTAGLVYDGRLVVDAGMRCAGDDRILAGGPVVKLSRNAGGQRLEDYASTDGAVALADRLLLACADVLGIPPPPSADSAAAAAAAGEPPRLGSTSARTAFLPGGLRFVYAAASSTSNTAEVDMNDEDCKTWGEPSFAKPPGGYVVATHSAEGLFKVAVDGQGTVVRGAFLGKNEDVSADMLTSLMNLPACLLHDDLQQAVESNEITCLVQLLLSPWLSNTLSPGFRLIMDTLVLSVRETMRIHGDENGKSKATKFALLDCQDGLTKWVADTSAAQTPVDVSS